MVALENKIPSIVSDNISVTKISNLSIVSNKRYIDRIERKANKIMTTVTNIIPSKSRESLSKLLTIIIYSYNVVRYCFYVSTLLPVCRNAQGRVRNPDPII
jgi:predicted house-cleaning noncanonical NTP pyrophosphatase (MazG superfamily)